MIEIKVPTVGESINEVTLVKWLKQDGAYVERDEVIAELESEKATFELNAEQAGVLKMVGKEGDTLKIGDVVAQIDETAAKPSGPAPAATGPTDGQPAAAKKEEPKKETPKQQAQPAPQVQPVTAIPNDVKATPVASAMIADKKVDPKTIQPSGYKGKILKEDVLEALAN
ncbi:MAG: E3 binding domain-containing protein, partial [Flavisolibacter sp.]|nr:E3 binding domain-containing protein [Flavisolibacter sp.]